MSSSSHSICWHYAKGGCPRGSRCRYRHVLPGAPHEDANATNDNNKTSNARWFNTTSERKERRSSSANPSSGANASTSSSSSASANASSSSNSPHIQSGRNRADIQNDRIPTTNGEGSGSKCAQKSTNCETVDGNTLPSAIPCRFYQQGYCRYGSECWFLHEIPDKSGNKEAITDAEDTPTCSICYEVPTTFGLLVSCDHVFCIDCVRNWRKSRRQSSVCSDQTKTCPLCRKKVPYVVPSSRVPRDAQDKDSIIDSYKAVVAKIPCKYFEETKNCPFGDLCLYQHANADGTRYIMGPPKRERRRSGIMWDVTMEDAPPLSFFESDVEGNAWNVLMEAFESYGYDWEVDDGFEIDLRDSDEDAFVYHPSEEPEDILTFLPSHLDSNEYDWGW